MKRSIDLNCDLAEGNGIETAVMPFISSANIACGYHAGNEDIMKATVALCIKHGVAIGAHPSFRDRANFGRTEMNLTSSEIYQLVQEQVLLLMNIVLSEGGTLHHVKPHGALYNMAARDLEIASAIATAVKDINHQLILYGLSGSQLIAEGKAAGLRVVNEVFADRTYQDNGQLTSRHLPGALITETEQAVAQCLEMIQHGKVTTITGNKIEIEADTICIHGDGPHAVELAINIYDRLIHEGVQVKSINTL